MAPDHVPAAGARAGELRAYGRMVRMLGRPVAQPDVSTRAPVLLVPGFMAGDATLKALAVAQPSSADELSGISGIGAAKLERYGDAVLQVLAAS